MAHENSTVNAALPARRWTRPYAITLSDVVADRNLTRGGRPYLFIENVGTSGLVMISWFDGSLVDLYMNQGKVLEGGLWFHAMSTGTAVGVDLRGYVGMEGRG